jgi:hypothetical protein
VNVDDQNVYMHVDDTQHVTSAARCGRTVCTLNEAWTLLGEICAGIHGIAKSHQANGSQHIYMGHVYKHDDCTGLSK